MPDITGSEKENDGEDKYGIKHEDPKYEYYTTHEDMDEYVE